MKESQHQGTTKVTEDHLNRKAVVYLRQSSPKQVAQNLESQRLQYAMKERARALGFRDIQMIDRDLGFSASVGAADRQGFDSLISLVAQGQVGIVLSREVSRLSRTDKDWCRLLEVCQLFGTLIGDEQQVYDLSLFDDQLVLGIKGTMSVVELNVLKMRMIRGQEEKARRGEMLKRLPSGYVRNAEGAVVITPDKRVREAIELVFDKFRTLWSVRQTFCWFRDHDVQLPTNPAQGGNKLVWQIPTQSFVRDVLANPFYAGAYVWGRRPVETVLIDGKLKKRQGALRRPEECRVFIPDHHAGYIEWETYEENQKIIRGNNMKWESDQSVTAVRQGKGLLTGLLRCGHCGRKLHVRYWGKSGTSPRYLCKGEFDAGGEYCLSFGGGLVDLRFGEEILKAISPLGVKASVAAIEKLSSQTDERRTALVRQLEQLEFEAQRAFEQYDEVDARNRLVASELERRWNEKLEEIENVKAQIGECDAQVLTLSDAEQDAIIALGSNFENVWNDKACSGELKKKIAKTIIEEVIASNLDERTIRFVIHWKGGTHTEFTMQRPDPATAQKNSPEALEIIEKMAVRYGDDQIAGVLNRSGLRTGKGKRWNQNRVKSARSRNSIPGQSRTPHDPEILTLSQAAKYCRVSGKSIEKLVQAGMLKMNQVVPRAPWEIRKDDLDADPVAHIINQLRNTGKLIIDGGDAENQISLLTENTGGRNAR